MSAPRTTGGSLVAFGALVPQTLEHLAAGTALAGTAAGWRP